MAKTKVKDKVKNALKSKLKEELLEKKEKQQEEIRAKNADLKECPYCNQLMDRLKDDGIKFTEKEQSNFQEEWNNVAMLTGVPVFPTILVSENYLAPRRDFQNVQQAAQAISVLGNKNHTNPKFEIRVIELLKSMGYGMNNSITNLNQQIRPIVTFIDKLSKELEQEEREEFKKDDGTFHGKNLNA